MSDNLPTSQEVFESQQESLAEAWTGYHQSEQQKEVICRVMAHNLVKLAQTAVLEQESDISE